jgi:acyl carrier protein
MSDVGMAGVRAALIKVDRRFAEVQLRPEASLVDDLGLDSIRFVDLAVALEDVFLIPEFPMQDWYDSESSRAADSFTLGSLAILCAALAREQSGKVRA